MFSDWFFPAYKAGGPIQSLANQFQQEEELNYYLICSNKDVDGTVLNVTTDQWVQYNRQTRVWYSSKGVYGTLLAFTANHTLFINGMYSWHYNIMPILFSKAKRKIVSARGMLYPGALAQKKFKKKLYLLAWKFLRIHTKVEFHATNAEEKKCIEQIFGFSVRVHTVPNLPRVFRKQTVCGKKQDELSLVSVALIGPMKNILLIIEALQQTKARIKYYIFGPVMDVQYWQKIQDAIQLLPENITVNYYGDLHPLKVEEALRCGHVFIQPSISENFGHSIYEAFSAGKPVITSHFTPWNNLMEGKAGINVTIDGSGEITRAINFFAAMDSSELEEWSRGAKLYSEKIIDLEQVREQYRAMFCAE